MEVQDFGYSFESAPYQDLLTELSLSFFAQTWVSSITTSSTQTTSARTGRAVSAPGSTSPAASFAADELDVRVLTVLRSADRAQTVRYDGKTRAGHGFTLAELKMACGIGIVVDHRRRNLSEEGKAVNVERLKAYKARLIVFPRNAKKPKKGDSTVRNIFLCILISL